MPDNTADRAAIAQLRKMLGRGISQQPIVQGTDIARGDQLPGEAERQLYGRPMPTRQDVNLPAESQSGPMAWLRQLAHGTFFGPKEVQDDPNAIVYQGDARGIGGRVR